MSRLQIISLGRAPKKAWTAKRLQWANLRKLEYDLRLEMAEKGAKHVTLPGINRPSTVTPSAGVSLGSPSRTGGWTRIVSWITALRCGSFLSWWSLLMFSTIWSSSRIFCIWEDDRANSYMRNVRTGVMVPLIKQSQLQQSENMLWLLNEGKGTNCEIRNWHTFLPGQQVRLRRREWNGSVLWHRFCDDHQSTKTGSFYLSAFRQKLYDTIIVSLTSHFSGSLWKGKPAVSIEFQPVSWRASLFSPLIFSWFPVWTTPPHGTRVPRSLVRP